MAKQLSNNQILIQECIKQEHLEYAPDMSEDSYFEIFSINQLLKNYDLNDDEVMNGITDGGNDGGCDGMYIFLNNDLLTEDQMGGGERCQRLITSFYNNTSQEDSWIW